MATRWKPDTCDCVVVFETDKDTKETKNFTFEKQCEHHADFADAKEVLKENQSKNRIIGEVAELLGWEPEKIIDVKYRFNELREVVVDEEITSMLDARDRAKVKEIEAKHNKRDG